MTPASHGAVTLRSADPLAAPGIDHGYLSDPANEDIEVIADGVEIAREIFGAREVAWAFRGERIPGGDVRTREEMAAFIRASVGIYYHPACTCIMGPTSDPDAVVDAGGQVHGLDGLYVCDASIFPLLMRANTNLLAAMLAEHLAARIGAE